MKKYILCFLACVLGMEHAWSENVLTVSDVTLPRSGVATIDVGCSFDTRFLGYQLDVVLADDLELVEDYNSSVMCENGFTGTDHSIRCLKKANHTYRFIVVSMSEKQLPLSGSLLKVSVRLEEGASLQGQVTAKVTAAKFTTTDYDEMPLGDVSFRINVVADKASQSLSLTALPSMTYGDADYMLPETTDEGLSLTWASSNTAVATVSNNTLTIKGAGTATITASQTGNDSYQPFSREYQLTVAKAAMTVTANDCSKQQGTDNPPLTVSYSGFKNGDNASSLAIQPTVTTTATKDSPIGTYPITVSGAASSNYEFTYVSGTLTVTEAPTEIVVTDISQMDNVVYIENTEAFVGNQVTLSVKMKNVVAIQTIQFDFYLPDGTTVVANDDSELITASKARIRKFNYFNSSVQADGALRLLAQATTTNVAAGDGEICTITLNIPDNMAEGEYPLIIKNTLLVEQDNTSHSPSPNLVQSKLIVNSYIPGDANNDGEINAIDFNMIGNHILSYEQPGINVKAADINGDGEINAIDFNMVGNIILNGNGAAARVTETDEMKDPA